MNPARADALRLLAELVEAGEPFAARVEVGGLVGELAVRPTGPAAPPALRGPVRGIEPAKGCGADVLRVLRECKVRLTGPQILDELADRDLEHSERSVTRWLSILREGGFVDNDPGAKPPGYGCTH